MGRRLGGFLDGSKRRCRGPGASTYAEQDPRVHLEQPMTHQDANEVRDDNRDNAGDDQGDAAGLQTFHKIRASGEAHHSDEARQFDRFEDR